MRKDVDSMANRIYTLIIAPLRRLQDQRTNIILVCTVCPTRKYTQQKSSAQMGFRVNPVLARNSCILCYISLFTKIILQQLDAFKIEILCTLTKLRAFKASRGHSSKAVKLPIMSPGPEDMEYLNNW